MPSDRCPGCGAFCQSGGTITHRYMESSPGCWAAYGEVLAREYSDPTYFGVHRLTVDAYAVQHPGQLSPQSIQSVALHLISLYLVLERGIDLTRATEAMQTAAKHKTRFRWLVPPLERGRVTIKEVRDAATGVGHRCAVQAWAESGWSAWSPHHDTIKAWSLPQETSDGKSEEASNVRWWSDTREIDLRCRWDGRSNVHADPVKGSLAMRYASIGRSARQRRHRAHRPTAK